MHLLSQQCLKLNETNQEKIEKKTATDFNKNKKRKRPSAIASCHVQDNDSAEQKRKESLRRLKRLRQLQLELSARVDGEDPRSRNPYGTVRPNVLSNIKY